MIDVWKMKLFPDRLGMYAPGQYVCHCRECGAEFIGDKRSLNCYPCSERIALRAENTRLATRVAELEGLLWEITVLRDETRDAQRLLLPAADPTGDARLAYGIIADRLDAALRGEEVKGD